MVGLAGAAVAVSHQPYAALPLAGQLQVGLEQDCPPASTSTHLLSPGVS